MKLIRKIGLVSAVVLSLYGFTGNSVAAVCNQTRYGQQLLCNINQLRTSSTRLKLNSRLNTAAQQLANNMAAADELDTESSYINLIRNTGYPFTGVAVTMGSGHNTAEEVFQSWQTSNLATLKATRFIDAGFGRAKAKNGTIYWAGMYGTTK